LGFILGKPKYALVCSVNSTVSIRVRREVVELADKMVRYELARSRSHAFNILIERGLSEVVKEVGFREEVYRDVEELEKSGFKISHDGLNRLLDEGGGTSDIWTRTLSYCLFMKKSPLLPIIWEDGRVRDCYLESFSNASLRSFIVSLSISLVSLDSLVSVSSIVVSFSDISPYFSIIALKLSSVLLANSLNSFL
jgi:hypothetical protein